ncbi:MAG: hypothetical protein IKE51_05745 [Solobacterium sp.]|nr:hypothetical protein [Solobacterium sp.]
MNNQLKKYCLALLSIDYSLFLFIPSVVLFAVMFLYVRNGIQELEYVIILIALYLIVVLILYNYQKIKIRRAFKKIQNIKEYDNCAYLGKSFLIEKRLLSYQNKTIKEFYYDQLVKVIYTKNKKNKDLLECVFEDGKAVLETGSFGQAQRTCAFLKNQNPNIIFEGIEPEGNGTLQSIEYPEQDKNVEAIEKIEQKVEEKENLDNE